MATRSAQLKYGDDGGNADERLLDADFESEKKYEGFGENETFVKCVYRVVLLLV